VILIDSLVHVLWFSYMFVSIGQIGKFFSDTFIIYTFFIRTSRRI
jgi:hypothetical protein